MDRVGSDAVPGKTSPPTSPPRPVVPTGRTLSSLAAVLRTEVRQSGATSDPILTGITHDSSALYPGDLFAALPGAARHGAEFAARAAAAGASAALTDPAGAAAVAEAGLPALVVDDPRAVLGTLASAIYGHPSAAMLVIGITGTAGKTSTAYLAEAGLRAAGHTTALFGTVETRLGDLTLPSTRTTPEATDLHAILAVARERGVTAVVMEVSSHALSLGRVGGVRFAAGGFTNFGRDHLDFHDTAADYFAAKARLFDGRCAVDVLNHDDPALAPLRHDATVTFSAAGDPVATWRADGVRAAGYRQSFTAVGPGGPVEMTVALPGRHNVANALLAIAALAGAGVDVKEAAAGIASCTGVPGRLERVDAPCGIVGVVDYAHKTDAIVAALDALRELSEEQGGRLICVLGAGGDRDRGKRPLMGAAAARGADLVVVTDDNPRSEDPAVIRAHVRDGACAAGAAGVEIIEVAGRRAAIDEAVRRAVPGDVVAVLGKGHERGQEVNGEVLPFDDRVELADALRKVAAA
nr:UDP-N-acetylmuramoyl-L-alanyl-D-glutamate--2,6-diaminopimelate ligase [Catenuloplanes indicus]